MSDNEKHKFLIASGSNYPELADGIVDSLVGMHEEGCVTKGSLTARMERRKFPNGELYVRYDDSVRERGLFITQGFSDGRNKYSVNDSLTEMLLMGHTAVRSSSKYMTAILPYFPYGRQDRQVLEREPISAAFALDMIEMAQFNSIVTVDPHSSQIFGAFNGPTDILRAELLLTEEIGRRMSGEQHKTVVVAPDIGSAKTSKQYADKLGVEMVQLHKERDHSDSSKVSYVNYTGKNIKNYNVILVDDMTDTARTLVRASEALRNSRVASITAYATHGLLSDNAVPLIKGSPIDQLVVTDTLPQDEHALELGDRLHVISVIPLIADAIMRITSGRSVSAMSNGAGHR